MWGWRGKRRVGWKRGCLEGDRLNGWFGDPRGWRPGMREGLPLEAG